MSGSWSEEELRATVRIYLKMSTQEQKGEKFNKKAYYRKLSQEYGRTEKAYEYRMQNISYIFALLGRSWVSGLKPAKNVGRVIGDKIEGIIAELENRPSNPDVGFEIEVSSYQKRKATDKPEGINEPKVNYSSIRVYERSAKVKAWVLNRANGVCELCLDQAPFTALSGKPYLEVHHVRRLSSGGSDSVSNCVALCPNCHRSLHYSINAQQLIDKLYEMNPELERE
ncbi:HNH endonuclease [Vibrio nigripulchritudo]|uniref:HNH endonuclease n=1 Tax=Vibrio nigripulchritudo TaxID=28173 RepID=UPI0024902B6E|nr:HNH endonuclease signature motif containing protein [Vibrio nigripulchritudo]BDU40801.1 HNH endonuclease [Vibrio nigripulchritudo]BDU46538.1 HNH endonuclease [Vibrio nigripulchritudo]